MQEKNTPPNNRSQQQCTDTVNRLVEAGNPKSNWFAVCIICNCEGETYIATKAVSTLTMQEVANESQKAMDEMWEAASQGN